MGESHGKSWRGWVVGLFLLHILARCVAAWTCPLYYPETLPWERSLAQGLGVPDHPPMDAAGLAVCGWVWPADPILAARFLAILVGSASLVLVGGLAFLLTGDKRCGVVAFLVALGLPGVAACGVLWVSDTPFLLFHLLGLCAFWRAVESNRLSWWGLTGVCLGLSLLCQLSGLLALLASVVYLITSGQHRRRLLQPGPWLAGLVGLVVCSHFVWLNSQDGWPAFRIHPEQLLDWENWGWVLALAEVAFEQLPNGAFVVLALLASLCFPSRFLPVPCRAGFRLVSLHATAFLAFAFSVGAFVETHPDWTTPAYPCAAVCAALAWRSQPRWIGARWLLHGSAVNIAVLCAGAALFAPALNLLLHLPYAPERSLLHAKIAKVQRTFLGWSDLQRRLDAEAQAATDAPPALYTLAPLNRGMIGYQSRRPVFDLAPLLRERGLTASYWRECRTRLEGGGVLFTDQDMDSAAHFLYEQVTPLEPVQVRQGERTVRTYSLFRVARLRAGTLERLQERPAAVWISLLKRPALDLVQVQSVTGRDTLAVEAAGWIGGIQGPGTTSLEYRTSQRVLASTVANLPRPDVAEAFIQTDGENGSPHPLCGFTFACECPRQVEGLELVAHTELGELVVMRMERTAADAFHIEVPAVEWSARVTVGGPPVYPGR